MDRLLFVWIIIGLSCKAKKVRLAGCTGGLTFCTLSAHIRLIFPSCIITDVIKFYYMVSGELTESWLIICGRLQTPRLPVRRCRGQAAASQQGASGSPVCVQCVCFHCLLVSSHNQSYNPDVGEVRVRLRCVCMCVCEREHFSRCQVTDQWISSQTKIKHLIANMTFRCLVTVRSAIILHTH